jgi:cytidyltransferase-like protein
VTSAKNVAVVSGDFDDIRSQHVRFLQQAARFGQLHVFLWDDALLCSVMAKEPKFPQQERLYYLQAIRYINQVHIVHELLNTNILPSVPNVYPTVWIVYESERTTEKKLYCQRQNVDYKVLKQNDLQNFPDISTDISYRSSTRKKVLVTGCFDWFHSGHVRFFEQVSELGDLFVVVGNDANIRELKGPDHPMFCEQERRYMVQSIRYVKQALISTGHGWLDAEPEIKRIKPDIYAVNEDGDKPDKRRFCRKHGIEYIVLKRLPKPGLPRRESSILRGY